MNHFGEATFVVCVFVELHQHGAFLREPLGKCCYYYYYYEQ